ncbi:MAG: 4Fe-4S binding protein [Chitinispirillales bacterium]|nr:4Fe-4S binding protein [Chitinispirillales bacterium]
MAIVVNTENCTGCGICLKACPESNVIKKTADKKVAISAMFCKMCLLCASVCPKNAIAPED